MEMEGCCSCGKKFTKTDKGFDRKSLESRIQWKDVDKTVKDVIEQEFRVMLTPDEKKRFICSSCSWQLVTMAKSTQMKSDASSKLKASINKTGYLAKKINIRSPYVTPRKIKRQRLSSPQKTKHIELMDEEEILVSKKTTVKYNKKHNDVTRACKYILRRQYIRAVNILMNCKDGFRKAVNIYIANIVRNELQIMGRQKESVFKGGKNLEEIKKFDWTEKFTEISKNCPVLKNILEATLTTKQSARYFALSSNQSVSVKPLIGTIMSILLYLRRPRQMTEFQELNSLQMWLAGCNREIFARFNHLGLCLGIGATMTAIDRIRKSYDEKVIKWKTEIADYLLLPSDTSTSMTIPYAEDDDSERTIPMSIGSTADLSTDIDEPQDKDTSASSNSSLHKGRLGFSICFDNVNQKVTVRHQTRDKQNQMFNMVQGYAARDRIPSLHLDDSMPAPEDVLKIPLEKYLPNEMDEIDLRAEMTTIVLRTLCEYVPAFGQLKDEITWHIAHAYSKESSWKSEFVPLGVMDKDESRVADMIDIMQEYQKYVPVKPTGHPFVLPLHADGLSCERGNDAQSARINGTTPWLQLQSFHMNIQEWHKRCFLLQDIFDELFSGSSCRDKGTLSHLKNYFNHRNVTTNVKDSFNFCEEFLQFCTDGYIVLCAMHLMNISSLDDLPDDLPDEKDQKVNYMHKVSAQIMDIVYMTSQPIVNKILEIENGVDEIYPYCTCKREIEGAQMVYCHNKNCPKGVWFHLECLDMEEADVPDGKWYCCDSCDVEKAKKIKKKKKVVGNLIDAKQNYTIMVIWRGLNQRVRQDAIRENDGDRMILHWKFDMLQFFENNHPKYFLMGQRLLSSIHGAVSKRLQHTLKWNRTVNPHGGKGKNIAMDSSTVIIKKV